MNLNTIIIAMCTGAITDQTMSCQGKHTNTIPEDAIRLGVYCLMSERNLNWSQRVYKVNID